MDLMHEHFTHKKKQNQNCKQTKTSLIIKQKK